MKKLVLAFGIFLFAAVVLAVAINSADANDWTSTKGWAKPQLIQKGSDAFTTTALTDTVWGNFKPTDFFMVSWLDTMSNDTSGIYIEARARGYFVVARLAHLPSAQGYLWGAIR